MGGELSVSHSHCRISSNTNANSSELALFDISGLLNEVGVCVCHASLYVCVLCVVYLCVCILVCKCVGVCMRGDLYMFLIKSFDFLLRVHTHTHTHSHVHTQQSTRKSTQPAHTHTNTNIRAHAQSSSRIVKSAFRQALSSDSDTDELLQKVSLSFPLAHVHTLVNAF